MGVMGEDIVCFQVKGANVKISVIGKPLNAAMCDDIIMMMTAQREALADDVAPPPSRRDRE